MAVLIPLEPYQYGLYMGFLHKNPWPFIIWYWNINKEHIVPLKSYSAFFIYTNITIAKVIIHKANPKKTIKQINLVLLVFLLSFLQKHFGLTEHIHIDIHIPIHAIAKIINIKEGIKRGIISENDFLPSIKSRSVNSSKSDLNGKLSDEYSL